MGTYAVDTDGGGSYSSLASAESALPATPTEIDTITCTGVTNDTSAVTINNERRTYKLIVSGEGCGATGDFDTDKYQLGVGHATAIDIQDNAANVDVINLQISIDLNYASGRVGINLDPTATGTMTIAGCKIFDTLNRSVGAGIKAKYEGGAVQKTFLIYNNIVSNFNGHGIEQEESDWSGSIYNNTIYDCVTGIEGVSTGCLAINNICAGNTTDYAGTFSASSDYNISSDTTAPDNGNSIISTAATALMTDPANNDFTLKTGSAAIDAGDDLSSTFTVDIIGTTRGASWDIGAFEFVSGGGGGTTVLMTINESIAAADESTGKLSAILSVSESAGASDIDQGQYATSQEMIEAVQANDLTTSLFNALLTQHLGAIASDSVSFKAKFGLTLNESASSTDSDTGKASLISTLSESLSGSDSLSFTTPGIILTIGETVASSDNLSISAHFKMTIGESANLTDSASSKASLISNIAEAIASSDAFNRISVFSLTISEAVSAIDLLSASNPNLLGLITATITIDPLITASSVINPLISGTITAIPTITGTIKVT
jgi:hypothetical protein